MAVPFRSLDDMLGNDASQGSMTRMYYCTEASACTAATSASGLINARRFSNTFTVPTFTGNAYMTYNRMYCGTTASVSLCALEIVLGTLTVSGNSFADGSLMPTRTIAGGSSAQLATIYPMVYVSTALTSTTPTLTITYKNQAGTGSRTATLTLPTSPVLNTAFCIGPHLQSGDTGIQDVTNISISTGSAGVLKVVGLLPLAWSQQISASSAVMLPADNFGHPRVFYPLNASDVCSWWNFSGQTAGGFMASAFQLQAEV